MLAFAGLLVGCSDNAPREREIGVTYRFENVRRQGAFDEWTLISSILSEHSRQPINPKFQRNRRVGQADLRDISAEVMVPNFTTLDAIQAELDKLGDAAAKSNESWLSQLGLADDPKLTGGSETLDFSLAEMSMRYTSNFVTSEVSIVISGNTARDNIIRLFLSSAEPPVTVTASRTGLWSARIKVLPETKYIYGSSQDPSERTRPKYFRIQLSTLRHENISKSEFDANAPMFVAPAPSPPKAKGSTATTSK